MSARTLAAATLVACLSGTGCGDRFDVAAMERMASLEPLDPQAYEAAIRSVEEQVFRSGPFDESRRQALSTSLRALADQMEQPQANDLVRHFAGELRTLARRTSARSPVQKQWMRIRGSVFHDAAWFAWSEADLRRSSRRRPGSRAGRRCPD
jgi:hypothetical protein